MIVHLLLVHILSHMKPITTLQPYIFKIHSSIILPPTLCSTWSGFSGRGDYGFFLFHLLHCPPVSHFKHLDFIITNYETPYYAILCCLHYLQIFSSAPHSQNTIYSTLNSRDHISYPQGQQTISQFCIF